MRYVIKITTSKKEIAEQLHNIISKLPFYAKNEEPISLDKPKEVCDECAKK
jgi:hypothetical protein